jgi:hypothetical protein
LRASPDSEEEGGGERRGELAQIMWCCKKGEGRGRRWLRYGMMKDGSREETRWK